MKSPFISFDAAITNKRIRHREREKKIHSLAIFINQWKWLNNTKKKLSYTNTEHRTNSIMKADDSDNNKISLFRIPYAKMVQWSSIHWPAKIFVTWGDTQWIVHTVIQIQYTRHIERERETHTQANIQLNTLVD